MATVAWKVNGMPDDKRIDLSGDLDKLTEDLLADVKTATEQVKKRKADDRAKDAADAEKVETKKTSLIIIGAAAVVLLVLAYFVVFANGNDTAANRTNQTTTADRMNAPVKTETTTTAPKAPAQAAPPSRPVKPSVTPHPPEGYDQPGGEAPM